MYIKELVISNFRGVEDSRFYFKEKQPAVLIGENGSGKSSTLDCIAILLSQFAAKLSNPRAIGRNFTPHDINVHSSYTANAITLDIAGKNVSWSAARYKTPRLRSSQDNTDLRAAAEQLYNQLEESPKTNIPLAVYYPTNRAVLDIPLRIRTRHSFRQTDAYEMALTGGGIAFRRFFEWFREREDIENEFRIDQPSYRDNQLTAVRDAIVAMRSEYTNLRVRRSPLRMVVTKGDQELEIGMLSDGEKCLLALVGDLARRLAIANPSLANPLKGAGIILIDEVELHLHPRWQREVVPSLVEAFPSCQFILTTHSPQVISDVRPENVFILDGNTVSHPESSWGRDTNRILEDVMGATERPYQIQEKLLQLFRLIDDGKLPEAKSQMADLALEIGYGEPLFAKAEVMINRRKVLAK
jgi:predicted ATP-binding protein involved in virulence